MSGQPTRNCDKCGGSITAEQIVAKQAGLVGGKLLCVSCVDVLRKQHAMSHSGIIRAAESRPAEAAHPAPASTGPTSVHPMNASVGAHPAAAASVRPAATSGDESIALLSDAEASAGKPAGHVHDQGSSLIKSLASAGLGTEHKTHEYHRPLGKAVDGATRCRTFHAKLTDPSIIYMDHQINEWVDSHPEITIKFCNSTIGVFEGKHAEQHLILTLFY